MRKFTKSLTVLGLLLIAGVASAKVQIEGGIGNLVIPHTYENIGAWGGTWSGNQVANEKDWSAYDYVWVKYSGFSGAINFGVMYSEFMSHQSWGDQFYDATASFVDPEGILAIKLDNTSVYVKGNAEEGGKYVGDVYAKHIREVFIQATSGGSNVTLEEMWVGSEEEYLADVIAATGFDTSKNHMLLFNNGAAGSNPWDHQANYTLPTPLTAGKTYVFEAAIKAVNGGETRLVPNLNGNNSQWLETKGLWTNEFTKYQVEFTASANQTRLEIDLGACAGEVYFDNVSLVEKGQTTNLIANGDFEMPGTAGWSTVNNTMAQVEYELGTVKDPGILVTIDDKGWIAFRTGSNIEISDPNVKAYIATYVADGNYLGLSEVTAVPSWQPVLIQAPKGKYMLDIPASVQGFPYDDNDLQAAGGDGASGDGLYMLDKQNDGVGFYPVSSVPAWQIFVQVPTSDTYPEFIEMTTHFFAVTIDDAGKDAANWQANPADQKTGETVTLKYNGKKKVKSITVIQK